MNWTDHAWDSITSIYSDILTMPFIVQLSDGSLPLDKFQFYMQQDAFYLEEFGRVLAFIGAKSTDNQQALDYFEFGRNALLVERALHENYFREFGLSPADKSNKIEPTCHHYVHFLWRQHSPVFGYIKRSEITLYRQQIHREIPIPNG